MAFIVPFIPAMMMVAGGFMKAAGDMSAANAAAQMAQQTASINNQYKQAQAARLSELGDIAYGRERRQGMILTGRSLGMLSGAGVDIGVGTPLDIVSQQTAENEYSAEVKRFNYAEQAWKISTEGILDIQRANLQTSYYMTMGNAAAIGDIVGGFTGAGGTKAFGDMFATGAAGGGTTGGTSSGGTAP